MLTSSRAQRRAQATPHLTAQLSCCAPGQTTAVLSPQAFRVRQSGPAPALSSEAELAYLSAAGP